MWFDTTRVNQSKLHDYGNDFFSDFRRVSNHFNQTQLPAWKMLNFVNVSCIQRTNFGVDYWRAIISQELPCISTIYRQVWKRTLIFLLRPGEENGFRILTVGKLGRNCILWKPKGMLLPLQRDCSINTLAELCGADSNEGETQIFWISKQCVS